MKDNTVFHFGTLRSKFSCFAKRVSNGQKKRGESPGGQRFKTSYFLRRTIAGATQSDCKLVNQQVLARYQQGFADLAEAMAWADSLFSIAPKGE